MKRVLIAMACMSIIGATALAQEQTEAEKEKYKDNSLVKTDKQAAEWRRVQAELEKEQRPEEMHSEVISELRGLREEIQEMKRDLRAIELRLELRR